jgi:hypothetical protein
MGNFKPNLNSESFYDPNKQWIWIGVLGIFCYLEVCDDLFSEPIHKSDRYLFFFPAFLLVLLLRNLVFRLYKIVKIENDLIKNVLFFLVATGGVFFVIWRINREAIEKNFLLILVYHVFSVLWLVYVNTRKNYSEN